ncbi:beta-glucosidase BglX [Daejeonella sp.]|uniref:beta-glucosidase BglX n=1 Tax=Daejeonella sp. TaxID=2805397 RepID=UPI0025C15FD3|nr:beta-glucosidase BglX [Daejeonella sp.]
MKNFNAVLRLLFAFTVLPLFSLAQPASKKSEIDKKVEKLLKKMTLEEKVGQMNQYNGFWEITGPAPKEGNAKLKYEHLKQGLVGSVLNVKGVENVRKIQEIVVKESRLGIPLLFGFDVIHGHKTLFPIPLAESASWDLQAIEKSARVAAIEASAVGINWTFAPMVDISRDARWGRVMEGAGEDPFLGSKIAVARVRGFQGDDLSANNTIAATVKHMAGYGFAEAGRDYNTVDVGTSTLYNVIFPPFKAAVDNDVKTVMNSFNVLNGIPATANKFLQRDILKSKWNFGGFIVSDWGSGFEMIDHGFSENLAHVAEQSANAGSDMDMESYAYVTHLKSLVESGKVSMHVIDDAVRRILKVKFELGLFDDPYRYCNPEREKTLIYHPDHIAATLDMAKKSIVLLKNEKQLLPLSKNQKKIAVIGALADDKNSPLGNWRVGSDDFSAVSVVEGLKKYTNEFTYAKGADLVLGPVSFIDEVKINNSDTSGFKNAIDAARNSEVVIMVLGEHGFQSGEGRSRANLDLPGLQQQLLEEVYKVNKNIVLVLMNGRPLILNWADKHIPAILETWQLGTQSGNAIAEVLFGDYNPSGKLPMTFPRHLGQLPIYYNYFNTGRPGPKPEVFWSHYTDEPNQPLYPFGYGLSYSQFKYSDLKVDSTNPSQVLVSITIKNTGKYSGEEVAQLYIRDKISSTVRPVKELKGFQKLSIEPGQTKELQFILTDKELGFYDGDGQFSVENGEFEVMVGTNSQDVLKTTFIKK